MQTGVETKATRGLVLQKRSLVRQASESHPGKVFACLLFVDKPRCQSRYHRSYLHLHVSISTRRRNARTEDGALFAPCLSDSQPTRGVGTHTGPAEGIQDTEHNSYSMFCASLATLPRHTLHLFFSFSDTVTHHDLPGRMRAHRGPVDGIQQNSCSGPVQAWQACRDCI